MMRPLYYKTEPKSKSNRHSPMTFQHCTFGCCSSSMPLDGTQGYAGSLNSSSSMPTASRQDTECLSSDPALLGLSLDAFDAPVAFWPQGPYANTQYAANSYNVMHHIHRTPLDTVQPKGHHGIYLQPTGFDTRFIQEQAWGHRSAVSVEATPEDRKGNAGPEILRCQWEGCQYNGTFGRQTELMRHVETQHVSPKAYRCLFPGCTRKYNRVDNLHAHARKVHGSSRSRQ